MNYDTFDLDGPQLVDIEYGPEPSLRDMILRHYLTFYPIADAEDLTERYITQFLRDRE